MQRLEQKKEKNNQTWSGKYSSDVVLPMLREKCPNAEIFLVRIFLYSD